MSTRSQGFVLAASLLLGAHAEAADQVIKTIPVGSKPAYSVSSPDGTRVYVGNITSADITVIDTGTDTVIATIPLAHNAGTLDAVHLTLVPDGTLLYAVDENIDDSGTVNVISTATNAVVATIPVGGRPSDIVVRPDGAEVYVVNHYGFSISVIATGTTQAATVPNLGYYPLHVAFSPDSRRAYVTRYGSGNPGGVTILDTAMRSVVASIDDAGYESAALVTPDGSKLYVTYDDPYQDSLVVLRIIATDTINDVYQVLADLTGPAASAWLAMSPDASKGYQVSSLSSGAQMLDAAHGTFAGTVALPAVAAHPAWDQTTGRVFVPHVLSNVVSVIDSALDAFVETYQTGNQPFYVTMAAGKEYVTNLADGTVTVIGAPPNHPPVANAQSVWTAQNTPAAIVLSATDADNDPLVYRVVAGPSHGTLSGTAPNVTYTPVPNYGGPDGFSFVANDGKADSNIAAVSIAIPLSTSARVTSSMNPTKFGDTVTLTATVTSSGGAPSGSVQFFDGVSALGTSTLTGGTATLATASIGAGARSITAVYSGTGNYTGSTSPVLTQSVSKASGTASVAISVLTPQYSDMETFRATYTPGTAGGPIPSKIGFNVGSQFIGEAPVALVGGVYQATWTGQLIEPYGIATRQMKPDFRVVTPVFDANFSVTSSAKAMTIQKEDARVAYAGATSLSLHGSATGTVDLIATEKDISAVPGDPRWDNYPGDIRNATVSFIDRSTNTIIGTVTPTVSGSDTTVGTATYKWSVNLGTANSKSYTIGFIVGYYYNRNSTTDNVVVVVSR
jgi:YVTN family beta-propeller protein